MHRDGRFYLAQQKNSCEDSVLQSIEELPSMQPEQVETFKEEAEEEVPA